MHTKLYPMFKKLFALMALVLAVNTGHAQYKYSINCIPTYSTSCSTTVGAYQITGVKTTGGTTNIDNLTQTPTCGNLAPNYNYFTGANKLLTVDAGTTCSLIINTNVPNSTYLTRWVVWVDWNQDDSFDNAVYYNNPAALEAELINTGIKPSETLAIAVPSLAKHGLTRMRIRTFGTGLATPNNPNTGINTATAHVNPCSTNVSGSAPILHGETEDYDVFVNNPCVSIPAVVFYNTNSKGTDVKWTPKGNEQLYEYVVDGSRSDPGNGNTTLNRATKNLHLPDTFMKFLACNTKFYFHIRGVCDTFDGNNQALWFYGPWRLDSFTTDPCCDMPPLSITDIKSNSAVATWQPVLSVQSYEYMIRIDTITPIKGTITNTTQVLLPGLQCSRMYYFFIRSLCSPTPTSDWRLDSFLTQPCLGIDNSHSFPEFTISAYPNPVKNIVTLSVMHGSKLTDGNIIVTDITGKVIQTTIMKEDKIDIDLSEQPTGIYLVKYADEKRTQVVKISKQ